MLKAARDSRVKQLKEEFTASDEFRELTKVKDDIMNLLEQEILRYGTDMLFQYGETHNLLMIKANNFFYEQGFADCLHILGQAFTEKMLEEDKGTVLLSLPNTK